MTPLNLHREIELIRSAMIIAGQQGKPQIVASLSRDLVTLQACQKRLDNYTVLDKNELREFADTAIELLKRAMKKHKVEPSHAEELKFKVEKFINDSRSGENDCLRRTDEKKRGLV